MLLLGAASVEAYRLQGLPWKEGEFPWADNDFFDRNNNDMDYNVEKFNAARRGAPITKEMEKEQAEDLQKAANKVYYPFKFNGHSEDDTGTKYAVHWECFGKPCPKKDVIPGDKRKYVS